MTAPLRGDTGSAPTPPTAPSTPTPVITSGIDTCASTAGTPSTDFEGATE